MKHDDIYALLVMLGEAKLLLANTNERFKQICSLLFSHFKMLEKEEMIRKMQTTEELPIARNENDVKMIQIQDDNIKKLKKEITVLNEKVIYFPNFKSSHLHFLS